MNFTETVHARKSIRGYLEKKVPEETIREILAEAVRAPSFINTQGWRIAVVTGGTLKKIQRENEEHFLAGAEGVPDFKYEGAYKARSGELGKELFRLAGITREDREQRKAWTARGFRLFDAPAAIFLSTEKTLLGNPYTHFDLGCLSYGICLAAADRGLGTCIAKQAVSYPDVVRSNLGLSEEVEPVIGIALGYPDPAFPANALQSLREPLDGTVTWYGGPDSPR
jgi:nitroreductase